MCNPPSIPADARDLLKPPDVGIDFHAAYSKQHAGTGRWLISDASFMTWLEQDNSFRWVHGPPGCGKSVLCASTIQHLFRRQEFHPSSAVAFFFFTFKDRAKQSASHLLRALLSQLSGQVSDFEEDLHGLEDYRYDYPPASALMDYLRRAVIRMPHTYILIDALDEIPSQRLRVEVLAALKTMREWCLPELHLLVTSRDEFHMRSGLQPLSCDQNAGHIEITSENMQEDIRQYISYQFDHDPELRRWGARRERIKEYLTQHADGVFQLVDYQLSSLRQCLQSAKYLEQCLSTLPWSMDAVYERTLSHISDELKEDAQRMLSLLCLSVEPLTVAEVIEALAVDINDLDRYDKNRKLERASDLCRICPGLIEIVGFKANYSNDDSDYMYDSSGDEDDKKQREDARNTNIVRIAHFSIKEYLFSDRIRHGSAASFAMTENVEHSQISKTCLLYLLCEELLQHSLDRDLIRQYPLAQFAARHWYDHYQQVDSESATQLAQQVTILLLSDKARNHWVNLQDPDWAWTRKVPCGKNTKYAASAIYYASMLGLDQIVANVVLESQTQGINVQGGAFGTALQAASKGGHERIVQGLLKAGADVNARGGRYDTALYAATLYGHEKIIQALLDAGADVNVQKGCLPTELWVASSHGHDNIVRSLLQAGADVNLRDSRGSTALSVASARGHETTVRILLEAGAELNP